MFYSSHGTQSFLNRCWNNIILTLTENQYILQRSTLKLEYINREYVRIATFVPFSMDRRLRISLK